MSEPLTQTEGVKAWIVESTEKIWQSRSLAPGIAERYDDEVLVHRPMGQVLGRRAVIATAMEDIHAFPDLRILPEDTMCSHPDRGPLALSQRMLSLATHSGGGAFGPATGTRLRYRAMSDALVGANGVIEEWRISDSGAILRQMGHSPQDWAQKCLGDVEAVFESPSGEWQVAEPVPTVSPWAEKLSDLVSRVMDAEFSAVPAEYDPACALSYPAGIEIEGVAEAENHWLPLRAAFPGAAFEIHQAMGFEEPLMPPRAALRWSLSGYHEGWGAFGTPSHRWVRITGMTHVEFGPRGVRREWTLWDELAVWVQILGASDPDEA